MRKLLKGTAVLLLALPATTLVYAKASAKATNKSQLIDGDRELAAQKTILRQHPFTRLPTYQEFLAADPFMQDLFVYNIRKALQAYEMENVQKWTKNIEPIDIHRTIGFWSIVSLLNNEIIPAAGAAGAKDPDPYGDDSKKLCGGWLVPSKVSCSDPGLSSYQNILSLYKGTVGMKFPEKGEFANIASSINTATCEKGEIVCNPFLFCVDRQNKPFCAPGGSKPTTNLCAQKLFVEYNKGTLSAPKTKRKTDEPKQKNNTKSIANMVDSQQKQAEIGKIDEAWKKMQSMSDTKFTYPGANAGESVCFGNSTHLDSSGIESFREACQQVPGSTLRGTERGLTYGSKPASADNVEKNWSSIKWGWYNGGEQNVRPDLCCLKGASTKAVPTDNVEKCQQIRKVNEGLFKATTKNFDKICADSEESYCVGGRASAALMIGAKSTEVPVGITPNGEVR